MAEIRTTTVNLLNEARAWLPQNRSNAAVMDRFRPLMQAGNWAAARTLMETDTNPDLMCLMFHVCLWHAAKNWPAREMAMELLQSGARSDTDRVREDHTMWEKGPQRDIHGSPLTQALKTGGVAFVEAVVQNHKGDLKKEIRETFQGMVNGIFPLKGDGVAQLTELFAQRAGIEGVRLGRVHCAGALRTLIAHGASPTGDNATALGQQIADAGINNDLENLHILLDAGFPTEVEGIFRIGRRASGESLQRKFKGDVRHSALFSKNWAALELLETRLGKLDTGEPLKIWALLNSRHGYAEIPTLWHLMAQFEPWIEDEDTAPFPAWLTERFLDADPMAKDEQGHTLPDLAAISGNLPVPLRMAFEQWQLRHLDETVRTATAPARPRM